MTPAADSVDGRSRWPVALAAIVLAGAVSVAGCRPPAMAPADHPPVMVERSHSHRHVHGPDLDHGHTHPDFPTGSHTHAHSGH